ncbi:TlpA family protein disulfide reductase [Mucilaginibacter pallidiroseus]|nr:thioredoxin domain-containing protein [Mucilaginibacter pallidiroseus]
MKRLIFMLGMLIFAACSSAQNTPPVLAPFKIQKVDNTYATPANLQKGKPVILIYFSPDCGHCTAMMDEMKPVMNQLKKFEVVMVTFVDIRMVKPFYEKYNLKNYPNFTVGTEGYSYVVQKYYGLKQTPYVAIYDAKGQLVKAFDKVPEFKTVMETIKKV